MPGVTLDKSKNSGAGDSGELSTWNDNLVYEDFDSSVGDLDRDDTVSSTFDTVYEYTGSGIMAGFVLTLEAMNESDPSKAWYIRLIIDGNDIFFGSAGACSSDFTDQGIYNYDLAGGRTSPVVGIEFNDSTMYYTAPDSKGIAYKTSVEIQIRKASSDKKFLAGYMALSKET